MPVRTYLIVPTEVYEPAAGTLLIASREGVTDNPIRDYMEFPSRWRSDGTCTAASGRLLKLDGRRDLYEEVAGMEPLKAAHSFVTEA